MMFTRAKTIFDKRPLTEKFSISLCDVNIIQADEANTNADMKDDSLLDDYNMIMRELIKLLNFLTFGFLFQNYAIFG